MFRDISASQKLDNPLALRLPLSIVMSIDLRADVHVFLPADSASMEKFVVEISALPRGWAEEV